MLRVLAADSCNSLLPLPACCSSAAWPPLLQWQGCHRSFREHQQPPHARTLCFRCAAAARGKGCSWLWPQLQCCLHHAA